MLRDALLQEGLHRGQGPVAHLPGLLAVLAIGPGPVTLFIEDGKYGIRYRLDANGGCAPVTPEYTLFWYQTV